jgi:hypothetical protein
VRVGRAAAIGDAQRHFAAGRSGEAEMEPLVEIGHVVLDDLEIDQVAVSLEDADVARVERARNRDCHGTFLGNWGDQRG